jgi:hypothetical protein
MTKRPEDRKGTRGIRVTQRDWDLWERAADTLGLTRTEYINVTMTFASLRHLGQEDEIQAGIQQLMDEGGPS